MACRTTPRPSPSPRNQSTCCGPNLANLATVDTTSIKGGFLVGLGSANQRRLKVILRARGGDLEGEGGKREKGKGKKEEKKGPAAAENASACTLHCKNCTGTSTVRGTVPVVVNGAKPKKRAISESNEWLHWTVAIVGCDKEAPVVSVWHRLDAVRGTRGYKILLEAGERASDRPPCRRSVPSTK
ncbi:hypothetical protein H0G86_006911 [Trichoderma simmonsii]|uniref:Uncharacterized protein n=1 Tax=Trichoderma simmonsii TaxID=1491479 RepID=A0A8G0PEJ9_9HYPO|nr:hypothetical protein H0G86_006911 [Trichoderma simmonsii]